MSNRKEIEAIVKGYGLEEGLDADYYEIIRKGRRTGKFCVTKRGIARIRKKLDEAGTPIRHTEPEEWEACGRIILSAWFWMEPDGSTEWRPHEPNPKGVQLHYTNGEADPSVPKTVEGTHPAAMALKRLISRGVLGVIAPDGSLYGEDEFTDETLREFRGGVAPKEDRRKGGQEKPKRAPLPQGEFFHEWAATLGEEWKRQVVRLTELTGLPPAEAEPLLLDHVANFPGRDGRVWPTRTKRWNSFQAIAFGSEKAESRGLEMVKKAEALVEELQHTGEFLADTPEGLRKLRVTRNDPAVGAVPAPEPEPEGTEEPVEDYGDIPF